MKVLLTIILILGTLFLPASKSVRDVILNTVTTMASGVERLVMRGDYAEVRLVDNDEFDSVIREPGRVVIVVIQKERNKYSRHKLMNLDHAMKQLPGKVLIAKVNAERNKALLTRLKVTATPDIRVYRSGILLKKFDATVDQTEFLQYVQARVADKPGDIKRDAPVIQPMQEDWLPPGVEVKPIGS